MTEDGSIPLTVIGGYLGAGKTTVLNRLLQVDSGRRLGVLVNDFGSINIDAALIARHDGETMSLTNGCICCTLANGFQTALMTLKDRPIPPEHIVVEASGVSDPHKIGQYGHLDGLRLDGVIVLADAENVRVRSRDRYVGKTIVRQLQGADILVLTKSDLVSHAERDEVRTWLRTTAPHATLLEANSGEVDPRLILGIGAGKRGETPRDRDDAADEHAQTYDTWTFTRHNPMTEDDIEAFAAALPAGIVRAKGLVNINDDPGHAAIFQLVGRRWTLTEGPAWTASLQPPRTEIVMIGARAELDWPLLRLQLDRIPPDDAHDRR